MMNTIGLIALIVGFILMVTLLFLLPVSTSELDSKYKGCVVIGHVVDEPLRSTYTVILKHTDGSRSTNHFSAPLAETMAVGDTL